MRALMDADSAPTRPQRGGRTRLTRLDTAKEVILDFVARRKNDRIGVVVFGRAAYILSPPTLDKSLLATLVSKMELGLIDGNGTAIGDAVGTGGRAPAPLDARARRRSSSSPTATRTPGSIAPDYAAHLAQTQAVHVYTVQIGNGDDVDVQDGIDLFGQPRFVREHFPVNPELLRAWRARPAATSFVANDKKGLEQSMHADPRQAREDALRGAGRDDGGPLPLPPPARGRAPRARGARARAHRAEVPVRFVYDLTSMPYLLVAIACGLLVALFAARSCSRRSGAVARRRRSAIRRSSRSSSRSTPPGRRALKGVLLVVALVSAFLALARPQWGRGTQARPGDQPRCRHRARLLEEHVRARRRAEPHRAREGGGRASSRASCPARASAPSPSPASR